MAGNMQISSGFDAEKQHVVLQINEGHKAWAHITLELPEFIEFIRSLANLRAMFAEQVPTDVEPGSRLDAVVNPAWMVMVDNPGLPKDAALLLLRHPGFGWLSFALPENERKAMGQALLGGLTKTDTPPAR